MSARMKTILAVAAVTTVTAVLLFLLLSPNDPAGGPARGVLTKGVAEPDNPRGPSVGVASRRVDPANEFATEHFVDPSRLTEFRREADRAQPIDPLQAVWQPMLIDMDLSDRALETYMQCSIFLLGEPCKYEIDYVIDIQEPGTGQIVFGRLVADEPYSFECEQYAKCTINGTVGRSVEMPAAIGDTFARRVSQTDNNNPYQTAEELEADLKMFEDAVEQMEQQGPDHQPDWEYQLAVLHNVITVIKWKLAQLQ